MAEKTLAEATFDDKLQRYLYVRSIAVLLVTVIGIAALPVWLFAGWFWSKRYFASLRCELTERRLRIHKGVVFQEDRTIMLDKIQDLTLKHGPIQRALGLVSLNVETAGHGGPQGNADAELVGVVDAKAFQEEVLMQRDRLQSAAASTPAPEKQVDGITEVDVLLEIRDALRRIEDRFGRSA